MNVFSKPLESFDSLNTKCAEDPYLVLPYQERITSSIVSVLEVACTGL